MDNVSGIFQAHFQVFVANSARKWFLTTSLHWQANLLGFLVFVGTCTFCFICRLPYMSFSETVAKWDVKTVNSEGYFKINHAKKAILQFGKYRQFLLVVRFDWSV